MNTHQRTRLIQLGLFILTVFTTTITGAEWIFGRPFFFTDKPLSFSHFVEGFKYSIPFLGVLTIHEFGHYFVARRNNVDVTLPFYIPFWVGGFISSFGTMGAFIRIKDRMDSREKFFDVGIAGPLAGFVAALLVLYYGFTHLPPLDYVFDLFPEFSRYGVEYGKYLETSPDYVSIRLGDSILFNFFEKYMAVGDLPHPYLYTNYPIIFAGYLSLFFTALNLFPIGQLDGGHILYGLIGDKAFNIVSPIIFVCFVFYAGLGFINVHEIQFYLEKYERVGDTEFFYAILQLLGYGFFIYLSFSRIFTNPMNNILLSVSVVAIQLVLSYFFPNLVGYSGFLAFGFLIGRFLGIYHPPTHDYRPLSIERKILGWLALGVFVICFSPQPFTIIQNVPNF